MMGVKINKIKESTIFLMCAIVFAKIIGMLRDVVLANYYGTSEISDAFLIAISVPTLLFYFIGNAISTAYLPIFNKIRTKDGEEAAMRFSNNLLTISLLLCTVIVLALFFFPKQIVKVFAAGFDEGTLNITAYYVRFASFSLYFMTIISILTGYLQANKNFIIPAIISLPRNAIIMLSIIISSHFGNKVLGIGILLALFSECVLLFPFAKINKYKYKFVFELRSPNIKETLYITLPIILGVGVSQINKIVDKSIASTVVVGGISSLSYAAVINNAVQEVLVTGLITILFAKCAELVAEGKNEIVKQKLSSTVETMSFVLIPASFGVVVLSELIVKCVLCRGSFDSQSLLMTKGALCFYTIGLPFLAVRDSLIKVLYAYKDTKMPTLISIVGIFINVVFNFVLSKYMGINGLALATSISAIVQCIALYAILNKKIGCVIQQKQIHTIVASIASGFIMYLLIQHGLNSISFNIESDFVVMLLWLFIGCLIYILLSLILRSPVAIQLLKKVLTNKYKST